MTHTSQEHETLEHGSDQRSFVIRNDVRKRLDVYLQQRLQGISRNRVQKLVDLGGVTINGELAKSSATVRRGDRIDVVLPAPAIRSIEPESIPLQVLYEDDQLLVVNKQDNLVVHPARSHLSGTLVNALAYHLKQQLEAAGGQWTQWKTRGFDKTRHSKAANRVVGLSRVGASEYRPGIVHRLDKDTTGCIVVAKSDEAHWQLARQFERRLPVKAYLAVVHGELDGPGGAVDQPIGKHPTIREAFAVRHDHLGKDSVTLYRVRERFRGYCLVELELKTGRTHQIRVHLSYLGHPIVGDVLYGGEPIGQREMNKPPLAAAHRRYSTFVRDKEEGKRIVALSNARDDLLIAHPALHAAFLQFTHPISKKTLTLTAPVHEPMCQLIQNLRKHPAPGTVATEGYWVDLDALLPN